MSTERRLARRETREQNDRHRPRRVCDRPAPEYGIDPGHRYREAERILAPRPLEAEAGWKQFVADYPDYPLEQMLRDHTEGLLA